MSSNYQSYRSVIVSSILIGIVISAIGAIVFFIEPTASANNSLHPISQRSETVNTVRQLAQLPSVKTMEATVYRDPSCGCCEAWMEHLRANGFQVSDIQQPDMDVVKQEYNVPVNLRSCHTAVINGAVIEGHVPADDIKRFLSEASDAIGLAVPGMPMGSPGMDAGEMREPFTVFSFDQQEDAEVFNQY